MCKASVHLPEQGGLNMTGRSFEPGYHGGGEVICEPGRFRLGKEEAD